MYHAHFYFSFTVSCNRTDVSQPQNLFFALSPSAVSRFSIHLLIYSLSYFFLLGTSYLLGIVLGVEDIIMNKADNSPAFVETNNDEG